MIIEFVVFLLTSFVTYSLYIYKRMHWKFDAAGIKYKSGIPVFGNTLKSSFSKRYFLEDIEEVYEAFPDEKYVAYFEATVPALIIRDPELIQNITVKDHDYFTDHKPFFGEDDEPLFGNSLIMMKGDRWRHMRDTLSPAFSSSKIRHMLPFVKEISNYFVNHLKAHSNEDVDIDDLMRRYTNDVIASTAFGLQVNSVKEKDNEFYKTGQNMFVFTPLQRFYFFLNALFPTVTKLFKMPIFSVNITKFFHNIVSTTMNHRVQNNVERPDMVRLLMESCKEWSSNELAGQLFIFFVAGFESTASTLVMLIHELAQNPDIQEKLYQELVNYMKQYGEIDFDGLDKLKYLDCIVNEGLRKWTVALVLDRVCTKAYELPPPREGGKPYVVQPGDYVYNMVNCLHMDPKYFPNPEVFDPERFSDENKHKIQPFTFLPFGVGPRSCIGSKFALMEVKTLLINLLLKFKLRNCTKTSDMTQKKPDVVALRGVGGTWIHLEERNN